MTSQSLILAENQFGFARYAWLYQDEIKALHVSIEGQSEYTGQVHWARVTQVNPALKGAFLELEGKLSAFLPFQLAKDFMPLTEGQYLMVQVMRDAIEEKELRVTTNIALRGLYWVAFPQKPGQVKLSKKIHAKEDIERIITLAEPWSEHYGLTARTAARSADNEALEAEYDWLNTLWAQMNKQVKNLKKPKLLVNFAHPLIRLLLEDVEITPEAIIFNSPEFLNKVGGALEENFHFPTIDLAVGNNENLFVDFELDDAFWHLLTKKVPLKSGGSLVIEETAAAVMIDVNSGNNMQPKQAQEVNFNACHEIAKQIRLRNLSGQILIDFISVKDKNHQQQIIGRLKQIMAHDPQKIDILGFTRLGILEITRQKIGNSLTHKLIMQKTETQFCYPLQRAIILQQLEAELKFNPKAAFRVFGAAPQLSKLKEHIAVISPAKIEYIEAVGDLKLEIY